MVVWRRTWEHRCEVGVEPSLGLVLLLLLFEITKIFIELLRKGGDLIVPKVTREDLGLSRLKKLDKEREQPGKVFRLGSFQVVSRQLFGKLPSI